MPRKPEVCPTVFCHRLSIILSSVVSVLHAGCHHLPCVCCILFLFIIHQSALIAAHAQGVNATISGTVTDRNGALVPGVSIATINVKQGPRRLTTTNKDGHFVVPLLDALQELKVQTSTFAPEFGHMRAARSRSPLAWGLMIFTAGLFDDFHNDLFDANDWSSSDQSPPWSLRRCSGALYHMQASDEEQAKTDTLSSPEMCRSQENSRFIMDVDSILNFLRGFFEIADYLVFKVGFLILAILGVKALIGHYRKTTHESEGSSKTI